MSLADFRARGKSSASGGVTAKTQGEAVADATTAKDPLPGTAEETSAPGVSGTSTQSGGFPEGNDGDAGAEELPYGVATSVTPSGTEIYYQAGPKRLYRLRAPVRLSEGVWDYSEWTEVPSVSTVLDCLEKGGLTWWGQGIGVRGTVELASGGHIDIEDTHPEAIGEVTTLIVDLLKEHKLTVNHQRDKAADRGTNVHKALEAFSETGVVPDPQFYPENERGYVSALVAFINDAHPVTMASELMVGSWKHGFAGRFDWLANLDFAGNVVVRTYPKRKPKRAAVSGVWLLDAKSKSATATETYKSHKIQIAGYEGGMIECGYTPPDHKGILNLWPDGRYELVEALDKEGNPIQYEAFLSVLETYNHLEGIK